MIGNVSIYTLNHKTILQFLLHSDFTITEVTIPSTRLYSDSRGENGGRIHQAAATGKVWPGLMTVLT